MSNRPNFDRLVPPPRAVPLSLRVIALFGTGFATVAWILLLFTTPAFWGFVVNAEVLAPIVLTVSSARADGRVTGTQQTGAKMGGKRVHWVDYSYQIPPGQQLTGRSYVTGTPPAFGAQVAVEYLPSRPTFSRLVGMRRAMFGAFAVIALVFPGFAAFCVVRSLSMGRNTLRLLREGVVDPSLRQMSLHVPGTTDTAELVDDLPPAVTANEQGELAAGPGIPWAGLALPLLVTLVNGACVVNHLK